VSRMPVSPFPGALAVLAPAAIWLTAAGLVPHLPATAPQGTAFLAAAALHASWLGGVAARRAWATAAVAFWVCYPLCRDGIAIAAPGLAGFCPALLLESLLLCLTLALRPPASWPERLARWRRARAASTAQLLLADGLAPWAADTARRLFSGRAIHAQPVERALFAAEMEDAGAVASTLPMLRRSP
jgi:hypothetical protein